MNRTIKFNKEKLLEFLFTTKGMITAILSLIVLIALIVTLSVFIISAKNQAPKALSAPNITIDQKTIRWGVVTGAQKYIVYVNDEEYARTDYNQFYIGDFKPGNYKFAVASTRDNEVSSKSNEISYVVSNSK
jgi:cell division protein YceG involved in septum cleavage